nr:GspH/FimT family pseudopilin [uncultured Rhodoferax sp.]
MFFRLDKRQQTTFSCIRLQGGFSIIELMVVIAILAVLSSLAGPSFIEAIRQYKIKAAADELTSQIQLARSEAIRRGFPVLLSRTTGCSNQLIDTDDWSCGWEVVVDSNRNGAKNASEQVLQTFLLPDGFGLVRPGLGSVLQINVWGQAQGAGQKFVFTPPEGVSGRATTTLCINSGGRIRVIKGDASCS